MSDFLGKQGEIQLHLFSKYEKVLFKCHIQLIPWILYRDEEKWGHSGQYLAHSRTDFGQLLLMSAVQ